jgi:hypothetical protein
MKPFYAVFSSLLLTQIGHNEGSTTFAAKRTFIFFRQTKYTSKGRSTLKFLICALFARLLLQTTAVAAAASLPTNNGQKSML